MSPEVHDEFVYLKDAQFQVVFSGCFLSIGGTNSLPLSCTLSSPSEISPPTVVSSAYLTITLGGWIRVQSFCLVGLLDIIVHGPVSC